MFLNKRKKNNNKEKVLWTHASFFYFQKNKPNKKIKS